MSAAPSKEALVAVYQVNPVQRVPNYTREQLLAQMRWLEVRKREVDQIKGR